MSSGRASTSGSGGARDRDFVCVRPQRFEEDQFPRAQRRRERCAAPSVLRRPQVDESDGECFEGLALHNDVAAPDASEAIARPIEAQDL